MNKHLIIPLIVSCFACSANPAPLPSSPPLGASEENVNCLADKQGPAPCDWANTLDVIVYGQVITVKPDTTQLRSASKDWDVVQSCSTSDPALHISLKVEQSTDSTLIGKTIPIVIGRYAMDYGWNSPPIVAQGQVTWRGDEGIAPGQRLGMPLHWDNQFQLWSPLLEQIFWIDETRGSSFQFESDLGCREPAPPDLLRLTDADELFQSISTCQPSATTQARYQDRMDLLQRISSPPNYHISGYCFDGTPR